MKSSALRAASPAVLSQVSTPSSGDVKTVVAQVPAPEKILITSDNRLFMSGADGLYIIARNGAPPEKIAVAWSPAAASKNLSCYFGGLVQIGNHLYASCSVTGFSNARNYVLAMDLTKNDGMRAIYASADSVFYNGLAADAEGNLYVSIFPGAGQGRIDRLTLATPTSVASRTPWLATAGQPNGLKRFGDTLYFSEEPAVFGGSPVCLRKAAIAGNGAAGDVQTVYKTTPGVALEDFILVDDGMVIAVASTFGRPLSGDNKVIHLSESGQILHAGSIAFYLPCALALEAGANMDILYVAERRGRGNHADTGCLSVFSQSWNLRGRK